MTKIYRAQSKCHKSFVPTALRDHNFLWLQDEFPVTAGICLSITPRDKSCFPKPESHLDERSIMAYYLSLRNILRVIHNNPIFKNFALLDEDFYDLFKDFHDNKDLGATETIAKFDSVFTGTKSQLVSFVNIPNAGFIKKLPFLKLSHHFQHFNLNFEDLPYIGEAPYKNNDMCDKKREAFPTMCLDFSDDRDVMMAFQFINDDSVVYSIDLDKVPQFMYDSYKREYDWVLDDVPIGKNTNKLMKLQKGYCIYWPWKYTIEELIENKMFDFRREQEA